MKNGTEIRANGVKIIDINRGKENAYPLYTVRGSKNGPWDYLRNARGDADAVETTMDFKAGFKTGMRWKEKYRPGGPCRDFGESNIAYDEWHAGFNIALEKRGVCLT